MTRDELVRCFCTVRADVEATDHLAGQLVAYVAAAELANPGVSVDASRFIEQLARHAPRDQPVLEALATLAVADLYLATGCATGDATAIAMFESRYARVIERAIAAAGAPHAERPDLEQILRQRILVHTPQRAAGIAGFTGRGSLAAWVRVIASREVTRYRTRSRRAVGGPASTDRDDDVLAHRISPGDPELDYVKRRYRAEFEMAFRSAVDALEDRDRLMLRQHTLDGLTIDELAAMYHVHRATAARWIAAAREAVLEGTQRVLVASLKLSASELDSLIRTMRSQLDVTLSRLLV